jgi:Right handed beta helix region
MARTRRGDSNYAFVISTAGSYYLTSNLDVTGTNGIHVTVSGVTLDLNGFQINRSAGSGGDGITIDSGARGCVVKNGSINGFAYGINCTGSPHGGTLLNLVISNCATYAVSAGTGFEIDHCTVQDNAGGGIQTGSNCILTNCSALNNGTGTTGDGFNTGSGSSLTGCSGSLNKGNGFVAVDSTVTACTAYSNTGAGIFGSADSSIINCTSNSNSGDGILVHNHCLVMGNTANNNAVYGIESDASYNRIDGNHCIKNTNYGIKTIDQPNGGIIVRNTCLLNTGTVNGNATANYSPKNATGMNSYFGPITTSIASGTPSPWANF